MLLVASPGAFASAAAELEQQRARYRLALDALADGDLAAFDPLRSRLDDYPLALYLDYYRLLSQRRVVAGSAARRFAARSTGSPLRNRFLDRYLRQAGRDRRWGDFLAATATVPRDVTLRCYYYRAQLADGHRARAFEGAAALWVHGYSRPEACDPLFAVWLDAGGATAERVWERLTLAFEARQGSLLRYLVRLAPAVLEDDATALLRLYGDPRRIARELPLADPGRSVEALHLALRRLARQRPQEAVAAWRARKATAVGGEQLQRETARRIAFRVLLAREQAAAAWVDDRLGHWRDDRLTVLRLRWLLVDGDWERLLAVTAALSEAGRANSRWRYWRGAALAATGRAEAAQALFAAAAKERNYYGFLAAERLDVPYAFNHRPLPVRGAPDELARDTGVRRVGELHHHGDVRDAHAEWRFLLAGHDREDRAGLARLAAAEGWHHLAIAAANGAAARDALELRFPLAYSDVFRERARLLGLPESELMAIARRESAFFPAARSPAGARGLMQVLPSTGRQVARRLGRPPGTAALYDVEDNVLIGSAYYRQLLDRFAGNRVLALAAYNAGPARVERWLDSDLPLERWIESIPYRETRDYVKAVLAYRAVFDYLQGRAPSLFRARERAARY